MILEMSMEAIFALVDIIFLAQVGDNNNAVATVGLTEAVITLVYAVAIGLSMGATAVVARRIGEKDTKGAREAAVQVIFWVLLYRLLLVLSGSYFRRRS